jgi:branched-chain amino acid transport system ATP-binding protein
MAELEIEAVSLSFGGLRVLSEVTLSAQSREILALIGPNGAGKTSLFNCIGGIYAAQGSIRFRGEELVGLRPDQVAALGVARTFQHAELFPGMTVIDNVLTGAHPRMPGGVLSESLGLPRAVRSERAERTRALEILAFVELDRYCDEPVERLPFGIQKRVGFARALAGRPALLLLDEPSAGLIREEREDLAHFILKTREALGILIVWIEHDMQMVADLADRILVLEAGRPIALGAPAEVLNEPAVIRAYLGAAPED